jgi:hypothetical protein
MMAFSGLEITWNLFLIITRGSALRSSLGKPVFVYFSNGLYKSFTVRGYYEALLNIEDLNNPKIVP